MILSSFEIEVASRQSRYENNVKPKIIAPTFSPSEGFNVNKARSQNEAGQFWVKNAAINMAINAAINIH